MIVLLTSFSFIGNFEANITGFAALESSKSSSGLFFFIMLIVAIGLLVIYKNIGIKEISATTLLNIRPSKNTDKKKIKKQFRSKIYNWFNKK